MSVITRILLGMSCIAIAGVATAEPADFSELLQQAEQARASAKQINQQRENEFLAAKDAQQQLLADAEAELTTARTKSEQLRQQFIDNQTAIAERQAELKTAQGDLAGLFSAARDASGSLQATIASSLLAVDYAADQQALGQLAATNETDNTRSPAELDALSNYLLRAAIGTGEVATFKTRIVEADGGQQDSQVVRIGVFNAISGKRYLEHIADINSLQVLTRQPSEDEQAIAQQYANTRTTEVMLVDPSRGNLLNALVARPDFTARIEQGGIVGYVIIGLAGLGLFLVVIRLLTLLWSGSKIWRQRRRLSQLSSKNALGRVLLAADAPELLENRHNGSQHENLELLLDEAVLKETPRLERGLAVIKLLAAMAPLLGLLGTVVGMIETFYDISIYGNGDPKLMADGISQALVTTMLGLIAAIPLLGSYVLLWLLSNRLIHTLDQESAGLLVRHFEAKPSSNATLNSDQDPDQHPDPRQSQDLVTPAT